MIPRYSREGMAKIWSDDYRFRLWLEVETLAMEAMVAQGIVPKEALEAVRSKAAFSVDRINEIEAEVKHDVIAFLTNVAENVGEGARYLHLGMTSSDLLDTSFAVQLVRATDGILAELDSLLDVIKRRALEHKRTICIGRSHGIHAEPTTFGLKLAVFHAELQRSRLRIAAGREGIAVGAISGPVGTFAHLTPAVEEYVCEKLGLAPAPASTQIIQRDRHAALFCDFAVLASTLEKMCVEVRHLQRTEVREAEEFFSKGQKGSSAMPHKRNPILSENVSGLARLVRGWAWSSLENIPLWHERDISHSSVERVVAPDITITTDFMLARTRNIFDKLLVYPEVMRKNLQATAGLHASGGLLVELAAQGLAREEAYRLVQKHAMKVWDELSTGKSPDEVTSFEERIRSDKDITCLLPPERLHSVLSLDRHLAHVDTIFERVFGREAGK